MQEIERHQIEILRAPGDRRAQRMEVRQTGFVGNNRLPFDDEAFGFDRLRLRGERSIFGRPVYSGLGVEADAVSILDELGAIAVEFDFVAPSVALGRLLDELGLHRTNEGQPDAAGRLTHRKPHAILEFDSISHSLRRSVSDC